MNQMRKVVLLFVVMGLMALCSAGHGAAAVQQDNRVMFSSPPGMENNQPISSVTFHYTGNASITAGQTWKGVTTNNTSQQHGYPFVEVDALAGMAAGSGPADFFNQAAQKALHLKEAGIVHWFAPNTGGTNSSGFTALPGGHRETSDGDLDLVGANGFYWSAGDASSHSTNYRELGNRKANAGRYTALKNAGFSVRCLAGPSKP